MISAKVAFQNAQELHEMRERVAYLRDCITAMITAASQGGNGHEASALESVQGIGDHALNWTYCSVKGYPRAKDPECEGGPPRRVGDRRCSKWLSCTDWDEPEPGIRTWAAVDLPTDEWLPARFDALGRDEQRLLLDLLDRIELGKKRYGAWVAAREHRDLGKEKREEVLDLLVYDAMERVRDGI